MGLHAAAQTDPIAEAVTRGGLAARVAVGVFLAIAIMVMLVQVDPVLPTV